ncbi:MAG: hypothetical protein ACRCX2_26820, partial [Paraclostridium sp.]
VNKDDADLFIQINNDEVAKIESQPMMLPVDGEEQVQPMVLEPRTVPTTYDCCFTVRKDDNYSLYINDGYENFADKEPLHQTGLTSDIQYLNDGWAKVTYSESGNTSSNRIYLSIRKLPISDDIGVHFSAKFRNVNGEFNVFGGDFNGGRLSFSKEGTVSGILTNTQTPGRGFNTFIYSKSPQQNFEIELDKCQITKTPTPKPFVKTIQPNCKMAFNTPATSETHSFIIKNMINGYRPITQRVITGEAYEIIQLSNSLSTEKALEGKNTNLLSSTYKTTIIDTNLIEYETIVVNKSKQRNILNLCWYDTEKQFRTISFSQLLIYKGNLTEAELKAELAKLDDQGFSYKKTENTWSISTRLWVDQYGLKKYDNPRDPFPFKTINNSGIKIMEETEDYQIWIDKDAVMTTVEKYVTGSYQTFLERKADIDGSVELLSLHEIEWTAQDDAKLFEDINNEALVKLEQSVMMLPVDGENEVQPIILEPKTVPTTYECCFRVDKKEKNFYIGEGYEYFIKDFSTGAYDVSSSTFNFSTNTDYNIKITTTESVSTHQ